MLYTKDMKVLDPRRHWHCTKCGHEHVNSVYDKGIPMHNCPVTRLSTPLTDVTEDTNQKVLIREDYVGDETGLAYDVDGKPVMAVVTEKADGSNDVHVYPGIAIVDSKSNQ